MLVHPPMPSDLVTCAEQCSAPCDAKTCAVHTVSAQVAGELQAAHPSRCSMGAEADASSGVQSGLLDEVRSRAPSTPGTSRPGESAYAASTLGLITRSACYRGPKPQFFSKCLGEGVKGVLASWRDGLPSVSCTSATLFAHCKRLLVHVHQNTFAPLSQTALGTFEVSGPCSCASGLNPRGLPKKNGC